ncbi:hypothetical protein [Pseudogemmobacter sonorensis]|uniref:hypothetical protein n=1 Tax=Pseudogemmobacter sonorensis TaxID=2989681 RepID=UPI0036D186F9
MIPRALPCPAFGPTPPPCAPRPAARAGLLALGLALLWPLPPQARAGEEPLSAIDWLSQSVTAPAVPPAPAEPPVASGGALPITVVSTPLDGPAPDAIGLIAPAVSGLPQALWGAGLSAEISEAVLRNRMESLPALRQLFLTMLLAETAPPIDSGGKGTLLLARIDKLLLIGALEQAAALLDISGTATPELFRRAFDIALLTGREDRACARMREAPGLAPTLQARVFCLARAGDWDAAALTLQTAGALAEIDGTRAEMLARFLDAELFEGDPLPPPPNPVTPLDWKIHEAVGETIPTAALPVAFAYAETSAQSGWKAQIEAAERLTRAGAIAPNVLLGLYTERAPAASGGVWDRVSAFQRFDAALQSGAAERIAAALPQVWTRMQEAELEVPFAQLFGRELAGIVGQALDDPSAFPPETRRIALRVALLSPEAERLATRLRAAPEAGLTAEEAFLVGLALGRVEGLRAPTAMGRAISPAFLAPAPSSRSATLVAEKRPGEAILSAIEEIARGVEGDLAGVTQGLSLLREIGLESFARRTALELMILERRG